MLELGHREGHAPAALRQAFLDYLETFAEFSYEDEVELVPYTGQWRSLRWLLDQLENDGELLPPEKCFDLELPDASTFGDAVLKLRREIEERGGIIRICSADSAWSRSTPSSQSVAHAPSSRRIGIDRS